MNGGRSCVLVVGCGLIGASLRSVIPTVATLRVVCLGRQQRAVAGYRAVNLSSGAGRAALATAISDLRPRCVVVVHGPSDVTWIEQNEAAAETVHRGVAETVAASAAPVVLVSTDNVFPGRTGRYRPQDAVEPANSYGWIKRAAEEIVLAGNSSSLVLRVSLVYGWTEPGHRTTFAERCLDGAADNRSMSVPTDQVFTPIHVRDVAAVIAGLCRSPGKLSGIEHLAGPVELSRFQFARLAYRLADADPTLVKSCRRENTAWACRPEFSSLECSDFSTLPGLRTWRPVTPAQGLTEMLSSREGPPAVDGCHEGKGGDQKASRTREAS